LEEWGFKPSVSGRINYSGMSAEKYDYINNIAKILYQDKTLSDTERGIQYLNRITNAGKKVENKRLLKPINELKSIFDQMKAERDSTKVPKPVVPTKPVVPPNPQATTSVATVSKAKGGKK
jgi:hypothetical protein